MFDQLPPSRRMRESRGSSCKVVEAVCGLRGQTKPGAFLKTELGCETVLDRQLHTIEFPTKVTMIIKTRKTPENSLLIFV